MLSYKSHINLHTKGYETILSIIILVFGLLFLGGCASTSVKEEPFKKFAESVGTVRDGTDAAMTTILPENIIEYKTLFISELEVGELNLLEAASLELAANSPFTFKHVPSYITYEQFKRSLITLAESMHQYSLSLHQLSNDEIQSKEEFEKITEELNANTFEAWTSFNKSSGENSAKNIALFSTAASALFTNYIKNKKIETLISAIEQNQSTVESFATRMSEGIMIIRDASTKAYLNQSDKFKNAMFDEKKRSAAIDALIALNRQHYQEIETLRLLKDTVSKFPSAHRNLTLAAKSQERSLSSIIDLINYGNQLKATVQKAQKSNKNSLLEAQLAEVESKVVLLEISAKLSSLDAAKARADAIIAKIEANAAPNEQEKQIKATELDELAKNLEVIAKTKIDEAKLARDAANAVKTSTEALRD